MSASAYSWTGYPVKIKPTTLFGETLRRLREQAAVSQSALAERADFDHSYVSRLESGARTPSREAVEYIAIALNLDAHDGDELLASAGFLREPGTIAPSCAAAWALDELHRTADDATKAQIEAGLGVLLWAVERRTAA